MKAYLHDTESGLYQGGIHEDGDLIKFTDGITTFVSL